VSATRCLRDEHQVILKVLGCFDQVLQRARATGTVSRDAFGPFLEFFRGFADACHHCKEEDRLFPCLEARGVPREGGPIGVMLLEHEQGRRRVRAMAEELDAADGGDRVSAERVLDQGQQFLELLRAHIAKEDNVLFNMADHLVEGDDLARLNEGYAAAEGEPGYQSTFGHCRDIADRLIRAHGGG
jgi:hemerythrin-like domain-containing protein